MNAKSLTETIAELCESRGKRIDELQARLDAVPDPMDIAYLSMGALQALDADGGKAYDWLNPHASLGQDGMIYEVITKCGPAVKAVWNEVKDEWDGVFLYDVVEPLGMWFINEWVRRETPPSEADAKAQARKWADE